MPKCGSGKTSRPPSAGPLVSGVPTSGARRARDTATPGGRLALAARRRYRRGMRANREIVGCIGRKAPPAPARRRATPRARRLARGPRRRRPAPGAFSRVAPRRPGLAGRGALEGARGCRWRLAARPAPALRRLPGRRVGAGLRATLRLGVESLRAERRPGADPDLRLGRRLDLARRAPTRSRRGAPPTSSPRSTSPASIACGWSSRAAGTATRARRTPPIRCWSGPGAMRR